MEAVVASGILKIVGNKLAPLLMKEYSSIVGAKKDLQELHGQVVEINNWLESVGAKAAWNDPSFNWLRELKDIAYEVDDIVDEFQLKAEKHDIGGDGHIVSKYLCNKPKSIIFQCKLASKIKAIKKKFAAIVTQRNNFSTITNSLPVGHPVHHMNMTVGQMLLLPNIDAASVLGRDKDKDELIYKLVEVKDQQIINIVSIIGLGGSGKTTLAKLVFNDRNTIDKHFEVKLWVHVSQEFDVAKIVGKLFEAIAGEKSEQYPLQQMSKKISDNLIGKRYLLVLDDVWTKDQILWDQLMVHLKSGTPGSAILLTMRSSDVAGTVRSTYQFSLPFLSLGDSWRLFQQSLGMPVKHLESEFVEVGKEIMNKCGGVPLAIKVIAGVLRGKELIGEWQAMRDSNLLDVESEEASVSVSRCLMLSYFHLPSRMKQCFTICPVFPKGYMLDKEQLIDQWIAHDMITPESGVEYLEYIGHKYFNSLVQMSFLQDVAEDRYGRVECRMHDLVHDLALSIMGDEISFDVPNEATRTTKSYRYFSLIKRTENLELKNIFRKARIVYMPWPRDYTNFMELKHAKHLRSVTVGYADAKEANAISQVEYLKYLSMSLRSRETFPEGITDVWSLQALHVTQSYSILELPKSIGKLPPSLQHLHLDWSEQLLQSPGQCQGSSSSLSASHLKKLQLWHVTGLGSRHGWELLQHMAALESLEIRHFYGVQTELPESLWSLTSLRSLKVHGWRSCHLLPESLGVLRSLKELSIEDCDSLSSLPQSMGQLTSLQELVIGACEALHQLPDCLGELCSLRKLEINYLPGLTCLPQSICRLTTSLQELKINGCPGIKSLPEGIRTSRL